MKLWMSRLGRKKILKVHSSKPRDLGKKEPTKITVKEQPIKKGN